MKQYLIFLRGVTPVGKNKVLMGSLREILTKAGLLNVQTYIQSGNVLANSDLSAAAIETLVHDAIAKELGGDIAIVAKTPSQIKKIFDNNPFADKDTTDVYFTLLQKEPDPKKIKKLSSLQFSPDEFVVTNKSVYLYCPNGYGRTRINNNYFERQLGVPATSRNYNTIKKMIELSEDK